MRKKLSCGVAAIMAVGLILVASTPALSEQLYATALNEMGVKLMEQGKYKQALDYYEQALAIDKKAHGNEHPNVATSLNNIGGAWDSRGKYHKALGYYTQALAIDKKVYGEQHPDVATDLNNIGGAWDSLGEHRKAKEYLEAALTIFRAKLGEEHPNTQTVKASLADIQTKLQAGGK